MRWRVVAVCCSVLGCEHVVGADDYHTVEPPLWADAACGECMVDKCAATTCGDDAACSAYAECLEPCARDKPACRAQCYFAHWQATQRQIAFDGCYRGSCRDSCLEPGGYYEPRGAACETCMRDGCREPLAECLADAPCDASAACVGMCTDPNCQNTCVDSAYTDRDVCAGTPLLTSQIGNCRSSCRDACALGSDWSCVDAYEWQIAASSVHRAFRLVHLFGPDTPYPSVDVDVCDGHDPLCIPPSDEGTSDAEGLVCLNFSSIGVGFQGFLGTHDLKDDQRTLYYVRHPVAHTLNVDQVILPTASEVRSIFSLLGVEAVPTRAHLAAVAFDCADAPADGVSFEVDVGDDLQAFYTRNNLPTVAQDETDASGLGGFVNLPVGSGPVRLRAVRKADNAVVAERRVLLRPGALTVVNLAPRAR